MFIIIYRLLFIKFHLFEILNVEDSELNQIDLDVAQNVLLLRSNTPENFEDVGTFEDINILDDYEAETKV